jgi:DNA-binding transcriptional LysR family regulator
VRHFPTLTLGLRLDDVVLRVVALEAGLGIGLLPCHLGDANPRLARAGAMEPVREGDVWLFTRPDARGVARIQAVSGFLQDLFARFRHRLEGSRAPEEEAP